MSEGESEEPWRPRLLGLIEEFDDWLAILPKRHVEAIETHVKAKLRRPWHAVSLDDRIRHTFVKIDEGRIWGYRIDYEITEMAMIVLAGKRLHRNRG